MKAVFHITDFATVADAVGWWMRDVRNISFENCGVNATEPDGRPAVVVENGENVTFNGMPVDAKLESRCLDESNTNKSTL